MLPYQMFAIGFAYVPCVMMFFFNFFVPAGFWLEDSIFLFAATLKFL